MMLTDNEILISAAKRNYDHFKVPTGSVQSIKTKRKYQPRDLADLDIKTSCNLIGEIVNCSQELNTLIWDTYNRHGDLDEVMQIYYDASLLDVLSNIEIDRAKREFSVDSKAEIKAIRQRYQQRDKDGRQIKPNFFGHVARTKGYYDSSKKNYLQHKTTMDFLQHCLNTSKPTYCKNDKTIMFSGIIRSDCKGDRVDHDGVQSVLDVVRQARDAVKQIWSFSSEEYSNEQKAVMSEDIKREASDYVSNIKFPRATIRNLLLAIEAPENSDIGRMIFYTLFSSRNTSFYSALKESRTHMDIIEQNPSGDMDIYGLKYARFNAF